MTSEVLMAASTISLVMFGMFLFSLRAFIMTLKSADPLFDTGNNSTFGIGPLLMAGAEAGLEALGFREFKLRRLRRSIPKIKVSAPTDKVRQSHIKDTIRTSHRFNQCLSTEGLCVPMSMKDLRRSMRVRRNQIPPGTPVLPAVEFSFQDVPTLALNE